MRRGVATALGVLSAWAARVPGLAEACAVCVGSGSEARGLGAGFYWSALLLTLLPFVLTAALAVSIGGAAGVWTSGWRRGHGARRSPSPEEPEARRVVGGFEAALDPVPTEDVLWPIRPSDEPRDRERACADDPAVGVIEGRPGD